MNRGKTDSAHYYKRPRCYVSLGRQGKSLYLDLCIELNAKIDVMCVVGSWEEGGLPNFSHLTEHNHFFIILWGVARHQMPKKSTSSEKKIQSWPLSISTRNYLRS